MTATDETNPISYVLPLRWQEDNELDELTAYLRRLHDRVELIIVDGSPEPVFDRHAGAWANLGRHLRPDPDIYAPMGKVAGVLTGLRAASHDRVVIADDDVRYDLDSLAAVGSLLEVAECVRPQNYFDELPWHARLDTARTLLNRSVGADYPGTLGVRRDFLLSAGGYAGDVIFENLELMRTVEAAAGRVHTPLDLYVARRPPSSAHFLSQRVRQAYDDFALPARMVLWLSLLPAASIAIYSRRHRWIGAAAAAAVGLAERGRRRAGGTAHFPFSSSLLAPVWLAERAVCSWLALGERALYGGVRYGSGVVPRAASSRRSLRRRLEPAPDGAARPSAEKPISL